MKLAHASQKFSFFVVACAIFVVFASTVQAQTTTPTPQQTITVQSGITFATTSGDQVNGTFNAGNAQNLATANDPTLAQASANMAGTGTGTQKVDPTQATAKAKTVISGLASTTGAGPNTVSSTIAGQQGAFVGVGDAKNGGVAGETTTGTTSGSAVVPGTVSLASNVTSDGRAKVSFDVTDPNNASASGHLSGVANAQNTLTAGVTPTGTPTLTAGVNGNGALGIQSTAGNLNGATYAAGAAQGTGSFVGSTQTGGPLNGAIIIVAKTNGKITPTSVSASSAAQGSASVQQ